MSARDVTYNGETIEAVMVGSYTLEMHYDPPMKVSEIRAGAEDITMLERRILGRADGMNEGFDSAAKEFTEVVKWDISTVSAEDLATWMEVTSSLRFCAGVTEEWADHVSEYKQARRRLITRWNDEAPAHEADLENTEPAFGFVWQKTPAEKAGAALSALKEELELEESTVYGELDSRSVEIGNDLKNGPTPEAVQRLIENGYVTWSYFNLGGDVESMPIEADPDEMADELVEYLADPSGYDGDITEVTAILGNIGLAAMRGQEEGSELTSDQVLFLTNFYDTLEEAGGDDDLYPGVLGIANQIPENANIDDSMKETLLGALGDGILALSDENIGGGYSSLPASIRTVVEGTEPGSGFAQTSWRSQAQILSEILQHTNSYLEGGEQFSVNLTQSVAQDLDLRDPETTGLTPTSAEMSNLIQVATRNEDANHAILSGEGPYEHPRHGLDPQMTLRGLYTFDWEDDGEAAGAITDWIWRDAEGSPEDQERAGEALGEFIDLFTDPEFANSISGTGYDIEGRATDANGKEVDMLWHDVSAGHLNPELSWAWSDLFSAYIDGFSSEHGTPLATDRSNPTTSHWNDGPYLLPEARKAFLQQIMGDSNAASRIYAEMTDYGISSLQDFPGELHPGVPVPTDEAARAGILRGLVDEALEAEASKREANDTAAIVYQNKVTGYGIDMAGALISEIPYPGSATVAEGFKIFSKDEFDIETYSAGRIVGDEFDPWEITESVQLRIMQEVSENNPEAMESIRNISPEMVLEREDGSYYISTDVGNWSSDSNARSEDFRQAWQIVEMSGALGNGQPPENIVEHYNAAYNGARMKV